MSVAVLMGAGSGMLHAVTGPDHLLSLGPAALRQPERSWRIGLLWGLGHGVGTLLLALPVVVAARFFGLVDLPAFAAVGDRIAGLALIGMAVWSWCSMQHHQAHHTTDGRSPVVVGFVHGFTGAASLLLVLPVLVAGSAISTSVFLLAFAVGSTLAMAAMTTCLARLGGRLSAVVVGKAQRGLLALSVGLGSFWVVGG